MEPATLGGTPHRASEPTDKTDEQLLHRMRLIAHKIMVLSGKGGVGKSTVAANLAVSLAAAGRRTGLLDIDIHGPSIPKLLGLEGALLPGPAEMLLPVSFNENLKVMSIGFLLPGDREAVIWRGPMKHKLIKQFLAQVEWGELDCLVVDSPTGTGDEPLSIAQLVHGADGAVVVTTPQEVALSDVRRCVTFCHRVGLSVIGVIENMSGFACPECGTRIAIFKEGGGEALAREMGVPFLGKIPLDPQIVEACDAGKPHLITQAGGQTARAFRRIIEHILEGHAGAPAPDVA
ncbi:MAG: Mrp/NBP35 family ATP-binding protein, partial [candidate division NC10 bacterium]|nr:Mrp/NBP35 family ATP-binding protein [candidate division NC10 bacterium]